MHNKLYTCVYLHFVLKMILLYNDIHVYMYSKHVVLFVLISIKFFKCVKLHFVNFFTASFYDIFTRCNMASRSVYFIQSL